MDVEKTIQVELSDGRTMEIDVSPQLMEQVRQAAGVEPTDAHVKYFLIESMRNALKLPLV